MALKMAVGQDALEELSRELFGGYNLNRRLLALLAGEPLDSRRQEAAVSMIQELSGVLMRNLMTSLFLLSSGGSDGAAISAEGSVDQPAPAKDERISSGEKLTPRTKVRGEVVKEDITASPDDAYQWKKYGQKFIQNRSFPRVYYRCMYSHDRGCTAKKQVQQRDNSSPCPMYQVTYVNEHTCRQVLPGPSEPTRAPPTSAQRTSSTPKTNFKTKSRLALLPTAIGGAPSPSSLPRLPLLESGQPTDLPSTMPDGAHLPSQRDVNMDLDVCSSPLPQVSQSDLEALGEQYLPTLDPKTIEEILQLFSPDAAQSISQCCGDDMPVAVTPFPDSMSAWPQYC